MDAYELKLEGKDSVLVVDVDRYQSRSAPQNQRQRHNMEVQRTVSAGTIHLTICETEYETSSGQG